MNTLSPSDLTPAQLARIKPLVERAAEARQQADAAVSAQEAAMRDLADALKDCMQPEDMLTLPDLRCRLQWNPLRGGGRYARVLPLGRWRG